MASDSFFLKEDSHFMTRFGLALDIICAFVCQNFEGNIKIMESFAIFDHKMAAAPKYRAWRGKYLFPLNTSA